MTDRNAAEIAAAALETTGFYSWRLCDWAEEIVEEVVELKDDDRDLELVAAELADSAVPIATLAAVELASSCLDLLCVEPQASTTARLLAPRLRSCMTSPILSRLMRSRR